MMCRGIKVQFVSDRFQRKFRLKDVCSLQCLFFPHAFSIQACVFVCDPERQFFHVLRLRNISLVLLPYP